MCSGRRVHEGGERPARKSGGPPRTASRRAALADHVDDARYLLSSKRSIAKPGLDRKPSPARAGRAARLPRARRPARCL